MIASDVPRGVYFRKGHKAEVCTVLCDVVCTVGAELGNNLLWMEVALMRNVHLIIIK
jgi:hypothetical protein